MRKFLGRTAILLLAVFGREVQSAQIYVNAGKVLHPVSPYLTGACLEDVNHEVYGGIYSQMVFGESFQEPASSAPLSGFTEYGGTWVINNGALFSGSGSGPKLMDNGFNQSSGDIKVQVQFASAEGGDAGIIFQVSQPGVGADMFTGYEVSLAPAGYVILGRHRQNWEPISQATCSVPTGQWLNLEVQYTNASIIVLLNGSAVVQYTDTQYPLTSGAVGLRNFQQDVQFQNFQINGADIAFAYDATNWPGSLSGMWTPVVTGSANGLCSMETSNVFVGTQSQRITFNGGSGAIGVANQGLNRWGMTFAAGNEYDGVLDVRAEAPVPVTVALESADGSRVYAQTNLMVFSNNWQNLCFTLTPSMSDTNGRLAVTLTQPGSVVVGYAFLQPGVWGRFEGLPVRKDVADGLVAQGVTVLRYGGSMVNAAGYRWKKMIGPRDRRPPYTGTWYRSASDGWGIPDFLNFCEAAGFLGIPDFNINETPQDMADFIQYVNGPTNTTWGAERLSDGHPAPYNLNYIELGNEERVDDTYYQKFQALAAAIWAADPNVTLVVGDFAYGGIITNAFNFSGAASGITSLSAHQQILQLASQNGRKVWFDVHVGTDGPTPDGSLAGMFSYDSALGTIAGGATYSVVVFELNANNHSQRRALANALAINAIERDGRLPVTTSANCLQPDGENDNGWDQGLLFLSPSQVWLQPPGYVTQMYSRGHQAQEIWSSVADLNNNLDVSAQCSADGNTLVLKVVNLNSSAEFAAIQLSGFTPTNPIASVETLSASLDAVNTAQNPGGVVPVQNSWQYQYTNNSVNYTFAPDSVTTLMFQGSAVGLPPLVLKHRYSFDGAAGTMTITDSVEGANGTLSGTAHLDASGHLVLPGGISSNNNNYAALPGNLLTGYTAVTLECWVAFGTNSNWGRLLDFGETDGSGNGAYCIDFTPHSGYSPNGINFEVSDADPGIDHVQSVAVPPVLDNIGTIHLVLIFDPTTQSLSVYTNGVMMGENHNVTIPMSAIINDHSYLGKSSYAGDPNGVATLDELRIYDGAMPEWQVSAEYAAGPAVVASMAPTLTIGYSASNIVLTWPSTAAGYNLQSATSIGPGEPWTAVSMPAPLVSNNEYQVTLPLGNPAGFYRLKK